MNFESNESFSDDLESRHPEQGTLHSLLDKITQLTNLEIAHDVGGNMIGRSVAMYQVPSSITEVLQRSLVVSHFHISEDPSHVASVTMSEKVGGRGDRLLTKYDFHDSPDGLQIKKHFKNINLQRDMLFLFSPQPQVEQELKRRSELEIATHAEEDAMGLSFVSEAETRELLKMLHDEFVPYGRKLK